MKDKLLGVLLTWLATGGAAQAAPVEFIFQDTVGGWAPCYLDSTCQLMPGVSVSDLITVTVIVDNGQGTLKNQFWYQSDVVSATAIVGSYYGEFTSPFYINDPLFGTDSNGNINWVWFYDTDLGNPDSFGNSINLSSNAITSSRSDGSTQYAAFFQNGPSNSNNHPEFWSARQVQENVPEPSSILLMLAAGLGMVGTRGIVQRQHKEVASGSLRRIAFTA